MLLCNLEASSYGMLFGVVDSATLAVCLEQYADFVLVQQCLEFDDCNLWKPYVDEEKVRVLHPKYTVVNLLLKFKRFGKVISRE